MWRTKYQFFGAVIFILFTGVANAGSGLVMEAGLHFGGDKFFSYDTPSGVTDINAGELYSLGIGVGMDLAPDLESRITFGVKEDGIVGSNGSAKFTRYPIDVLLLKRLGVWKVGAGLTYHLSPEFNDTTYPPIRYEFRDALGGLLELDRDLGVVYVGMRLTLIEYERTDGRIYNGNSFGVVGGIRF